MELLQKVKMKCGLKKILEQRLKEHTIMAINDKNIDNIKNVRFETILVTNLSKAIQENQNLNDLFQNSKYLIVNADNEESIKIINNMKLNIITFGFNQKSTITASSVEEPFLLCLQRKILDINKKTLEPQEIEVKITDKNLSNSSDNLIAISSILLIYGKKEIFF